MRDLDGQTSEELSAVVTERGLTSGSCAVFIRFGGHKIESETSVFLCWVLVMLEAVRTSGQVSNYLQVADSMVALGCWDAGFNPIMFWSPPLRRLRKSLDNGQA